MVELSISDISKKPSLLDNLDDIAKIVNRKKNEVKGIFIPIEDKDLYKDLLEEIEYRRWLKRNKKGLIAEKPDFLDNVVSDIGDKL